MNIAWSEIFDFDGLVEIVVMLVTVMYIFEWKYSRRRTILTAVGCGVTFFLCNTAVIVGNEVLDLVSDTVRFNLYAVLIVFFGFLFAVRCLKGYWQQHLVTILFSRTASSLSPSCTRRQRTIGRSCWATARSPGWWAR